MFIIGGPNDRGYLEMRRNMDPDYYNFDRNDEDGTKEVVGFRHVERAGEEGAPEGWTPVPSG